MDRDSRILLARIKAYKMEGLSHRAIARKLGVSAPVVGGLVYRDRHGLGIGQTPPRTRKPEPVNPPRGGSQAPTPRPNDCLKHLLMIQDAHGTGFPYLSLAPGYRVAA